MRRFARLQLALLRSVRSTQTVIESTLPPSSSNAPPTQELELGEPIATRIELRQSERRRLLAQHWARGALCSRADETWRPICTALAVAALACNDLDALGQLVAEQVGTAGIEPQLANVWRQALLELHEASNGEGSAIVDTDNWPFPALRVRSRELLQSAQTGAEQLVSATH